MSNAGKYIDRNPCIKSAGLVTKIPETIGDVLKIYSDEEAAEAIIREKCGATTKAERPFYRQSPLVPTDTMKDVFSTELKKSRFVEFREKFSEDLFFKKPELGKVHQLHAKPEHVTNENTTFGPVIKRSEPAYQLVLPEKTPGEVNREYIQWHDKYRLSHSHYFPSERIDRQYNRQHYNPESTFGIRSNADITGGNVKRCLTRCERMIIIKKAQKVFLEMSMGKLGKRSKRYESFPNPDTVQGKYVPRDECDAKALIENIHPCVKKTKLVECIAHINRLRRKLFSRMNFHINDFKAALVDLDQGKTGYLPLSKIFEAAYSLRIHMHPEKIRTAVQFFELFIDENLQSERVDYESFLKILQIQYPLPKTGNISTMPDNVYNKETTYRELCNDMGKKPVLAPDFIMKKKEEKTSAKDLITPDIPLRFGLGQSDFDERRPKEELRCIFKRVITDPTLFEAVWQQAKKQYDPENDLISVDELRSAMTSVQ